MREPSRSERRIVTCVFIDIVGSTDLTVKFGSERMRLMLDEAFAEIRVILQAQGATIEKYAGDSIFALFGAPIAHADDPLRALRAAEAAVRWANARTPEASPITVRIGVETGEALVDIESVKASHERMAVGACVNVAARLQSAAPVGGVLVGPICREAARDVADFEDSGTFELKGLGQTRAYALIRVTERQSAPLPFVGRDRELVKLRELLGRASGGEIALAVAVGPPGQGKTRLLEELVAGVDAHVLIARCRPDMESGQDTPLRQLLGAETELTMGAIASRVAAVLPDDPASLLVAEALAQSAGIATFDRLERLRPADRQDALAAAWRTYLTSLARERLVIVWVEDLHWAEAEVVRLLDRLAGAGEGRVFVLASARPEFSDTALIRRGENRLLLDLGPLDADDARRLATSAGAAEAVVDRAEGNPLFIVELARAKRATDDVPLSVQGAIGARLDELSATDRDLLQRAAVAGETFAVRDAALLAEGEPAEAAGALARLAHLRYLRPVEDGYRFHHALVREVAYGRLPVADRMRLHARFAQEGVDPSDSVALAYHWWSALGGDDAAWVWTDANELARLRSAAYGAHLAAAEQQQERFSHERAQQLYERAATLADDPDAGACAETGLGLALMRNAQGDAGWKHYHRAIEMYRGAGQQAPASLYAEMVSFPLTNTGYFVSMPPKSEIEALLETGIARARETDDERSRAHLLALRCVEMGDMTAGEAAEEIIGRNDPMHFAEALRFLVSAYVTDTRFEQAAKLAPVLDRAIEEGGKTNVPEVRLWEAIVAQAVGDLPLIKARAAQLTAAAEGRPVHTKGHDLGIASLLALTVGDWEGVTRIARETERLVVDNPQSTFCLISAAAVSYGRVADLRAGHTGGESLRALMERMCPGLPVLHAALEYLPRALASEPMDDPGMTVSYSVGSDEKDRAHHDVAALIPAAALVIAERWDMLDLALARLDGLSEHGARASSAMAEAVREEIAAAKGGPAPQHAALRAMGFVGYSELLRLRAKTLTPR